jgi:quercetin dioxygenase-like cupin family protein
MTNAADEPTPPMSRSVLLDARLERAKSTERVEARRIHMRAGVAAGLHVHNCPVVGSVVEGRVAFQVEGEAPSVLGPGDVFFEPEGVRIARFDAIDEDVTFLAYFLLGARQEPAIEVPE